MVEFNVPLDTVQVISETVGPSAVMCISHSVMEGQRHNKPLNPHCFCLQRSTKIKCTQKFHVLQLHILLLASKQRQHYEVHCQLLSTALDSLLVSPGGHCSSDGQWCHCLSSRIPVTATDEPQPGNTDIQQLRGYTQTVHQDTQGP